MKNLTYSSRTIRVLNAVAAGTSDQNSAAVDTLGFAGVRFVALFGTLTATQVTSIYAEYSDDGTTGWTEIAGSRVGPLADADSNKALVLDVYRPQKRYVRCVVDRGTANAVIDGVIAELYLPADAPVTRHSSVAAQEVHNAPHAGTA